MHARFHWLGVFGLLSKFPSRCTGQVCVRETVGRRCVNTAQVCLVFLPLSQICVNLLFQSFVFTQDTPPTSCSENTFPTIRCHFIPRCFQASFHVSDDSFVPAELWRFKGDTFDLQVETNLSEETADSTRRSRLVWPAFTHTLLCRRAL